MVAETLSNVVPAAPGSTQTSESAMAPNKVGASPMSMNAKILSTNPESFEDMDPEMARLESQGNRGKVVLQSSPVSEAVSLFLQSRPCHELLAMYAEKEYTLENLFFWRNISDYRKLLKEGDAAKIAEHELLMLDLYINDDSDYVLNLSYELGKRVRATPHNYEVWFEVQTEVATLIRRGPYLRMALEVSSRVSSSWKEVMNRVTMQVVGQFFYKTLFDMAPEVRPLFKADISSQAEMLTEMVDECVGLLVNLEQLLDVVLDLGKRHHAYKVTPEHFKFVGESLIKTLQHMLKDDFDPKTQQAWVTVYELISTLMIIAIDPSKINQFIVDAPVNKPHAKSGHFPAVKATKTANVVKFEDPAEVRVNMGTDPKATDGATRNKVIYPLAALLATGAGVLTLVFATDITG